jgi:hypothetical protein
MVIATRTSATYSCPVSIYVSPTGDIQKVTDTTVLVGATYGTVFQVVYALPSPATRWAEVELTCDEDELLQRIVDDPTIPSNSGELITSEQ